MEFAHILATVQCFRGCLAPTSNALPTACATIRVRPPVGILSLEAGGFTSQENCLSLATELIWGRH